MLANFAHLHGIEHEGWTLLIDSDSMFDRRKLEYEASKGSQRVKLDWSPYRQYEERHFRAMVDLGFPRRPEGACGALFPHEVDQLAAEAEAAKGRATP